MIIYAEISGQTTEITGLRRGLRREKHRIQHGLQAQARRSAALFGTVGDQFLRNVAAAWADSGFEQ